MYLETNELLLSQWDSQNKSTLFIYVYRLFWIELIRIWSLGLVTVHSISNLMTCSFPPKWNLIVYYYFKGLWFIAPHQVYRFVSI